jgi:hypothetical protein
VNFDRYLAAQRKGVNVITVMILCLLAIMWTATLVDWAFDRGWGWDRQILWFGPPMALFTLLVRFCALAIFKFVGGNL